MNEVSGLNAAEIVKVGHPALRLGTQQVRTELFGSPSLNELVEVMKATLKGNGVGLAAPQIAVPRRLFVIDDPEERMTHLSAEQRAELGRYRRSHPIVMSCQALPPARSSATCAKSSMVQTASSSLSSPLEHVDE